MFLGMGSDRFRGSNASGMARAVVDEAGRLIDLELEPELLRRPAALVAGAVVSAVLDAQGQAAAIAAGSPAPAQERSQDEQRLGLQQLEAELERANLEADRRLSQFATLVADLNRGMGYR
jgi:restriction endonuclease Mrr